MLHFLLIGAILFAAYGLVAGKSSGSSSSGTVIEVTQGQVSSMVALFERTWHRQPTLQERAALVDNFVRDEVLYREGVALGLDRDDNVIRRRVRQRLEVLAEEAQEPGNASEAELQDYLERNRARFELEPRVSFRQKVVGVGQPAAPQLAHEVESAPLSDVTREFGSAFAGALMRQPAQKWIGPVHSAFGTHMVYVTGRLPARMPALDEVREKVESEWRRERRAAASEAMYRRLLARYTVSVAPASTAAKP
jgi:hypothetical protein